MKTRVLPPTDLSTLLAHTGLSAHSRMPRSVGVAGGLLVLGAICLLIGSLTGLVWLVVGGGVAGIGGGLVLGYTCITLWRTIQHTHQQLIDFIVQQEAYQYTTFQQSVHPMYRTAPDGTVLQFNDAMLRLLGYSSLEQLRADLGNPTATDNWFYIQPGRRAEFLQRLRQQHALYNFESQVRHRDGHRLWITEDVETVTNFAGEPLYYQGYIDDRTEIYASSEQIEQQAAHLESLLQAIPDRILRVSHSGMIREYRTTPTDPTANLEIVGKRLEQSSLFPIATSTEILHSISDVLATRHTHLIEYQHLHDQSVKDLEARIAAGSENDVLILIRDISERKLAERMKNEFISIVSHELRTPLTAVRGALDLMVGSMSNELPPNVKSLVELAQRNAERLIELVNDILDIEKIETGQMAFTLRPVELIPVIEQALTMNQPYAQQYQVTFALTRVTPDVCVYADAGRLLQVLTNLLSNAAKFSHTDGRVEIAVLRNNGNVRVEITDYGIGIAEEFRPHIFKRFAQQDPSNTRRKGGSGLGLSICRAIMDKMNGTIDFTSEPGVTTTFFIELPEWQHFQPRHVGAPRILIIEDTPDLASTLSITLSHYGFAVDIAYNTEQARLLIDANTYTAMTLDLLMPGQDGLSFLRELRATPRARHLPVIVVSAIASVKRAEAELDELEVLAWLDKPVNFEQLIQQLQRATQHTTAGRARILHIEDDPDVRAVVAAILRSIADIDYADTLTSAQQALAEQTYNLVLLETECAGLNGLASLNSLRDVARSRMPLVIFSVHETNDEIARHVEAVLVKSRTSNKDLATVINNLLYMGDPVTAPLAPREDQIPSG